MCTFPRPAFLRRQNTQSDRKSSVASFDNGQSFEPSPGLPSADDVTHTEEESRIIPVENPFDLAGVMDPFSEDPCGQFLPPLAFQTPSTPLETLKARLGHES